MANPQSSDELKQKGCFTERVSEKHATDTGQHCYREPARALADRFPVNLGTLRKLRERSPRRVRVLSVDIGHAIMKRGRGRRARMYSDIFVQILKGVREHSCKIGKS